MPSNRPRGEKEAIQIRRERVSELLLERKTQREIARILGVSTTRICRDLKAIHAERQQRIAENIDRYVAESIAVLEKAQREFWDAWQKSLADAEETMAEMGPQGKRTRKKRRGQSGKPEHLKNYCECQLQILRLLGILEPEKRPLDPQQQMDAQQAREVIKLLHIEADGSEATRQEAVENDQDGKCETA